MNIELVDYTQNALQKLIYTKATRLDHKVTLDDIMKWDQELLYEHLSYMLETIQSSFEFVDYTFRISGVSRAFTHQLVRTRTASYQQEAQRAVDCSEHGWIEPSGLTEIQSDSYKLYMKEAFANYTHLLDIGVNRQDARGVIPTNVETSIFFKANLRTLSQMSELRLCYKAQGEYQKVFREIRDAVLIVHPWAEPLLQVTCAKTGICAFPNYIECPLAEFTYNNKINNTKKHKDKLKRIKIAHSNHEHEANPIAIEGKTQ